MPDMENGVVEVSLTLSDWAQAHAGLDAWAKNMRGTDLGAKYFRIAQSVMQQVEGAIERGDVR